MSMNTLDLEVDMDYVDSSNTSETGIASLEANLATDTDNDSNYHTLDTTNDTNCSTNDNNSNNNQQLLQDVRELRSELQRLRESESWYREELHQQKHHQLLNLEQHYAQQRQHVQQNQRLQHECLRLCGKCGQLERDLLTAKRNMDKSVPHTIPTTTKTTTSTASDFAQIQQKAIMTEQQQLIDLLRTQKQTLLSELQHLKQQQNEQSANTDLQLATHRQMLLQKEQHVLQLRQDFQQQLQATSIDNMEQVHQLSLSYYAAMSDSMMQVKQLRQQLLSLEQQQSHKTQAEWQLVLQQVLHTQQLTEQQAQALADKRVALEELNALFLQQNVELQELQVQHATAGAEIERLKAALREHEAQQARLQQDMAVGTAETVMQHRQQMRALKTQVKQLWQEREVQQAQLQHLERELKRHKRRALIIPDATQPTKSAQSEIDDRLRILSKVLEGEHQRKLQRYELHIRSLLRHIKSLKSTTDSREVELLQTVHRLEEELLQKADIKKLIQQSAAATKRPSTNAVLQLIEQSEQCMPQLVKLESAVCQLRQDVQSLVVPQT